VYYTITGQVKQTLTNKNRRVLFMTINKNDKCEQIETGFFQTPNWIFDKENELTEHELVTYLYLCRCCNQGGKAFPSYTRIGLVTKTSRTTAIRAVKGLIEKGFLTKQKRTRTSNLYKVVVSERHQVVSDRHQVVSEGHHRVVSEGHPINNYLINNKDKEETLPISEGLKNLKGIQTWLKSI
jgi:hypothetical protein